MKNCLGGVLVTVWSLTHRIPQDTTGQDRTGLDTTRTGPDRTGPDRTGPDRTGPDRTGLDRTVPTRDRTGPAAYYISLKYSGSLLHLFKVFRQLITSL